MNDKFKHLRNPDIEVEDTLTGKAREKLATVSQPDNLYPAQQGEVLASGVVRIQTDMQWIGSAYIGVGMRGKIIKYKGKQVELIIREVK